MWSPCGAEAQPACAIEGYLTMADGQDGGGDFCVVGSQALTPSGTVSAPAFVGDDGRVIDDVEVFYRPPKTPTPTPPPPDGGELMGDHAGRGVSGTRSSDKPAEPSPKFDVPMSGLGAALRVIPRDELSDMLTRGKLVSISKLLKKASASSAPPVLNSAADEFPHLAAVSGYGQAIVGSVELIIPGVMSHHLMKDADPDGDEHARRGCAILAAWANVALAEKGYASISSALYAGYVRGDATKPSPPDERGVLHVTIFKVPEVRGWVGAATAHDLEVALRVAARGWSPLMYISFVFATYPRGFDVAKLFRSLGDSHRQHIMQQLLRFLRPMQFAVVEECAVPPGPSGELGYFALLSWVDLPQHIRAEDFIKSRLRRQGFVFDSKRTAVPPLPLSLGERRAIVCSLMTPECAKRMRLPSRRSFGDRVRMQAGRASHEQLLGASSPAELLQLSGFLTEPGEPGTDQYGGIQRLLFVAAMWLEQHRRGVGRHSWSDTCWCVVWDYATGTPIGTPTFGADERNAVGSVCVFRCGERDDVDCRVVTVNRSVLRDTAWGEDVPEDGGVLLAALPLLPVPPGSVRLFHGTNATHATSFLITGASLAHVANVSHDFGLAFYATNHATIGAQFALDPDNVYPSHNGAGDPAMLVLDVDAARLESLTVTVGTDDDDIERWKRFVSACRLPHGQVGLDALRQAHVLRGPLCVNNEDVDSLVDVPAPSLAGIHRLAFSTLDGMNFVSPGREGNGVTQVQVIVTEVSSDEQRWELLPALA